MPKNVSVNLCLDHPTFPVLCIEVSQPCVKVGKSEQRALPRQLQTPDRLAGSTAMAKRIVSLLLCGLRHSKQKRQSKRQLTVGQGALPPLAYRPSPPEYFQDKDGRLSPLRGSAQRLLTDLRLRGRGAATALDIPRLNWGCLCRHARHCLWPCWKNAHPCRG